MFWLYCTGFLWTSHTLARRYRVRHIPLFLDSVNYTALLLFTASLCWPAFWAVSLIANLKKGRL